MTRLQLCSVLAVVMLLGSTGPAQERREESPSFEGQFLSIAKKSSPGSSVELEKVQLRALGGRAFLVGVGTDTPENWQKGKTVWVAVDDVAEITVFATLEELRKAIAGQEQPKKDGGGR